MQMYAPSNSRTITDVNRTEILYEHRFGSMGHRPGHLFEPGGIAVTLTEDIAVADTKNHRIQVYDRDGKFKFQFGMQGKEGGQFLFPNR